MAENLAYLPAVSPPSLGSSNGTVAGGGLADLLTKYYYVYGYEGSDVNAAKANANYTAYGVLYNFPAAEDYYYSSTPPNGRGICPSGWHLRIMKNGYSLLVILEEKNLKTTPGWYFYVGAKMMETGFVH